jgi:hypothetical protein
MRSRQVFLPFSRTLTFRRGIAVWRPLTQHLPKSYSLLEGTIANVVHPTAVQQVLNGTISEKGILAPLNSKINDPLMKELKEKYG